MLLARTHSVSRWWLGWGALLLAPLAVRAAGFDPVAATDHYLSTLPAAARARSDAYFEGGYWLPFWDLLITAVLMWLLLRFRVVQCLRDWALVDKTSRRLLAALVFVAATAAAAALLGLFVPASRFALGRYAAGAAVGGLLAFRALRGRIAAWAQRPRLHFYLAALYFCAGFMLLTTVLGLPWALYTTYFREHAYGLSNLSLGGWFADGLKSLLANLVLLCPVGALLYLGIRRAPNRWWLLGAGGTPVLLLLLVVISPVFLAPLFNTYRPLPAGPLRDRILSLARANGVPATDVYEFDASKQTKRISANVSGALGTTRISLNDNLVQRCTPAEVEAVMAHELGHYVLNHSYRLLVYLSLVGAAGFAFTHYGFAFVLRRKGARWGLRGIDDFAALPVLLVVANVFILLAAPVTNTISRTTEAEADIFGLNAARQPDAFATVALKLAEYRKLAPGPVEEFLFFDHPSGRQRILMAMRWKAENLPSTPAEK